MQIFEGVPSAFLLILALILLIWLVLVFLVPFMVEGIRSSSRKTCDELREMNEKLDRLTALLADQARLSRTGVAPGSATSQTEAGPAARKPAPTPPAPERRPATGPQPDAPTKRREPTISDTPPPTRTRREPALEPGEPPRSGPSVRP
jgi:hypothetical protein